MARRKMELKEVPTSLSENEARPKQRPPLQGQFAAGLEGVKTSSELLESTRHLLQQGILSGKISIEISPEQIVDEVGSDRLKEDDPEEFEHLIENIKERGQRQPIRVRPVDPAWKPDSNVPMEIPSAVQFALQSGRRRLAACARLGRKVLANISVDIIPGKELSDLEERFFENTARKQLSVIEELLAIGLIAKMHPNERQQALGQRLNRQQNYVSYGKDVYRYWDEIESRYDDPTQLTLTEIKVLLPALKQAVKEDMSTDIKSKPQKSGSKDQELPLSNGGKLKVKTRAKGLTLSVDGIQLTEEDRNDFAQELASFLERYAANKSAGDS